MRSEKKSKNYMADGINFDTFSSQDIGIEFYRWNRKWWWKKKKWERDSKWGEGWFPGYVIYRTNDNNNNDD